MNDQALILMAKFPHPDTVKTRLKGHMTDIERVTLYQALLRQTIQKMKSLHGIDTFITYTPHNTRDYFLRFGLKMFPQADGNLGEKMFEAMNVCFQKAYRSVVLIGVDIPDVTDEIVKQAFDYLRNNDIVFGPAADGGYYLVGLTRPFKKLFDDIPWSTGQVLMRSLEKAKLSGYSVAVTEILEDIDTIDDIKRSGLME
ncbi:MAG: TIGR04282 family arsenosugar biosynthesis glycosyltransferase [Nitrospiraceae bacterium]|nr:MAG: TIGR04282 family arsenosugar biosynthesis glycosyltransferase [Nitrospiraceae bacterium]